MDEYSVIEMSQYITKFELDSNLIELFSDVRNLTQKIVKLLELDSIKLE